MIRLENGTQRRGLGPTSWSLSATCAEASIARRKAIWTAQTTAVTINRTYTIGSWGAAASTCPTAGSIPVGKAKKKPLTFLPSLRSSGSDQCITLSSLPITSVLEQSTHGTRPIITQPCLYLSHATRNIIPQNDSKGHHPQVPRRTFPRHSFIQSPRKGYQGIMIVKWDPLVYRGGIHERKRTRPVL